MRILLELLGAGVFIFIVVKGTDSWISYRVKADKALRDAEAKQSSNNENNINKETNNESN